MLPRTQILMEHHLTSNKMNIPQALSSSSPRTKISFLECLLAEKSLQYGTTTTAMYTSIVNDNAKAHLSSSSEESWSEDLVTTVAAASSSFKNEDASLRSMTCSFSSLTDDDHDGLAGVISSSSFIATTDEAVSSTRIVKARAA
jgi:hypothetical protein